MYIYIYIHIHIHCARVNGLKPGSQCFRTTQDMFLEQTDPSYLQNYSDQKGFNLDIYKPPLVSM